jgi:hypothetical protein
MSARSCARIGAPRDGHTWGGDYWTPYRSAPAILEPGGYYWIGDRASLLVVHITGAREPENHGAVSCRCLLNYEVAML